MPPRIYIQRLVNLEQSDDWTVRQHAGEKGLGAKGFSAALRLIIREWRELKHLEPPPSNIEEVLEEELKDALRQVAREWFEPPQPQVVPPAPRSDPA
ncbi:MAG TPA: hypothetical protein VJL34_03355 [Anaerolineales bacterium]|nr:hypothetical protein [Anaerolineales bacterium]